jgi:hypothetical protein
LLRPSLDLVKINAILRYLERSKSLEIDLDGNIIWIREEERPNQSALAVAASISKEFQKYFFFRGEQEDTENENEKINNGRV